MVGLFFKSQHLLEIKFYDFFFEINKIIIRKDIIITIIPSVEKIKSLIS